MRFYEIFELIVNEIDSLRILNCESCSKDIDFNHSCVTDIFSKTCFELAISKLFHNEIISYDEFLLIQKLNVINGTETD